MSVPPKHNDDRFTKEELLLNLKFDADSDGLVSDDELFVRSSISLIHRVH